MNNNLNIESKFDTKGKKFSNFIKIGASVLERQKINLFYNIPFGLASWMATNNMPLKDTLSVATSATVGVAQYLYEEKQSITGRNVIDDIKSVVSVANNKVKSVARVGAVIATLRSDIKNEPALPKPIPIHRK